jgi:hypothetical protein
MASTGGEFEKEGGYEEQERERERERCTKKEEAVATGFSVVHEKEAATPGSSVVRGRMRPWR